MTLTPASPTDADRPHWARAVYDRYATRTDWQTCQLDT